jgi:hypothetical protein
VNKIFQHPTFPLHRLAALVALTFMTMGASCPGNNGGGPPGSGGSGSGVGSGGSGSGQSNACERDSDCSGANAKCDKSSTPFRCVNRKELGQSCSNDQECHGGLRGTQRICHQNVCTDACRRNSTFDCPTPGRCEAPQGQQIGTCRTEGCTLNYPSVSIVGIPTPQDVRNSYTTRGCGGQPACMIDTNNIINAANGQRLAYNTVRLSPSITLREMSHQSANSSPYVYVDPEFVRRLQAIRDAHGSMTITSGFRSPIHQNNVCRRMCGQSFCSGTCAKCSNHMDGKAADLQHSSPKCALARKSCNPGRMHLIFNELAGGDHLHIDIGPANPVCRYKDISCP